MRAKSSSAWWKCSAPEAGTDRLASRHGLRPGLDLAVSLHPGALTRGADSDKLRKMPVVRVVLVRPQHPANVGACARSVKNAGLAGIDLVRPGDWRTVESWRTAWGAHEILEQARVFDDLAAALRDSQRAVAFSGRRAGAWVDVRELAEDLAELDDQTRVSLVFGPEASGLTLDELATCGERASIPAHSQHPSLNLSHAVMVAAYELFRASPRHENRAVLASRERKQDMLPILLEGLRAIGALQLHDAKPFIREWTVLFSRIVLTNREAALLEHMARKMTGAGRDRTIRARK